MAATKIELTKIMHIVDIDVVLMVPCSYENYLTTVTSSRNIIRNLWYINCVHTFFYKCYGIGSADLASSLAAGIRFPIQATDDAQRDSPAKLKIIAKSPPASAAQAHKDTEPSPGTSPTNYKKNLTCLENE